MPRKYVAKPGAKRYKKYDDVVIQQALDDMASTNVSLSVIAEKYKISKSVLCRHKNREMKPHGRPTALTQDEENYIVEHLNICGDWGYPLDVTDLRYIVKMYLDSMNIKHKIFKNNLPGIDYVNGFMKRHADKISKRICQNIKRSRAAVSPDTINQYFDELGKSLENVPTQNIINYDETNLTDDPGRKKVIVRRGCKYPERIVNHSKGSISLMMAATANGEFLPPYVVYKAAHLYDSWTMKGPHNARYNRTSSGWFDGETFEDWIKTIVVPFFEKREGKKILIGDNLSSHLSVEVIKECREKNIHFVFLPANSTHLTQPLDVAVFRPMKMAWRFLLDKWKKSEDGRTQSCVPKGCFPRLLKLLMDDLNGNAKKNITSGFRKCGIFPFDANKIISRLPQQETNEEAIPTVINESFLNLLKEMRYGSMNIKEPTRKRKLEVVAGKSVSAEEVEQSEDQEPKTQKKKRATKITNKPIKETPKTSSKGKGVGKKSKPKIEAEQTTNEIPSCSNIWIEQYPIEEMPITFDCQVLTQPNQVNNEQQHVEQNNNFEENKVINISKSKIKIISDVKLKLPLPRKKLNNNSYPKKTSKNFYEDTDEILKILEED